MAELKFKVGQKVKVVNNYNPSNSKKKAMVGKVCEIKGVGPGHTEFTYAVWNEDKSDWWWFREQDLQAVERTLDDLVVGDILVNGSKKNKVLGLVGQIVFLSLANIFDMSSNNINTVQELKKYGYTLKQEEQPEETTELTLKEVADKFNIDVDKLRIKE